MLCTCWTLPEFPPADRYAAGESPATDSGGFDSGRREVPLRAKCFNEQCRFLFGGEMKQLMSREEGSRLHHSSACVQAGADTLSMCDRRVQQLGLGECGGSVACLQSTDRLALALLTALLTFPRTVHLVLAAVGCSDAEQVPREWPLAERLHDCRGGVTSSCNLCDLASGLLCAAVLERPASAPGVDA
eukprot:1963448-Pleurochrysis_carterae.AAC.1